MKPRVVHAYWDGESGRWWAESDDIPGLMTEAESFELLVGNIRDLAPDLLLANGCRPEGSELPITVRAEHPVMLRLRA